MSFQCTMLADTLMDDIMKFEDICRLPGGPNNPQFHQQCIINIFNFLRSTGHIRHIYRICRQPVWRQISEFVVTNIDISLPTCFYSGRLVEGPRDLQYSPYRLHHSLVGTHIIHITCAAVTAICTTSFFPFSQYIDITCCMLSLGRTVFGSHAHFKAFAMVVHAYHLY